MPKVKKNSAPASATSANVGYEAQLWQMADALRGSMDAAEYKHVCLDRRGGFNAGGQRMRSSRSRKASAAGRMSIPDSCQRRVPV